MRLRRAVAAGLCVCASATTLVAADRWVRIDTPNFVVFSQIGPGRTSEVAQEFERFRESLARVIPSTARPTPVPTVIVAFKDAKSFAPYRLRTDGKPLVGADGFFAGRREQNVIAFAADRADTTRVMFHEYTHLVTAMSVGGIPSWLREGLAEFYSTFELHDRGTQAILGKVLVPHVMLLRERALSPEQFLRGDPRLPEFADLEKRRLFYAQAWGVVHMLLTEQQVHKDELTEYARRTEAGEDPVAAWRAVFGQMDLLGALKNHVHRQIFGAYSIRFSSAVQDQGGTSAPMTESDVDATLADVLRIVAPAAEALPRLQRAASAQPVSWRARALLGLAHLDQNENGAARPLLIDAARNTDDWLVRYYAGAGLARIVAGEAADDGRAAALDALTAVLEARPDLPEALAWRGLLLAMTDTGLDEAMKCMRRAHKLAPGRPDYALNEVSFLLRKRDAAGARTAARSLLTGDVPEWVRTRATELIAAADAYESRAGGDARREVIDSVGPGGRTERPIYRELRAGEQRTEGDLLRIECPVGRTVFHLRVGSETLKFTAPRLDKVDFITYRPDPPSEVRCGVRPAPEHVFITWRPAPGARGTSDRVVVSVELLPDL